MKKNKKFPTGGYSWFEKANKLRRFRPRYLQMPGIS